MCFSAEADIAGGVIAGVIGLDAVRHAEHKRELGLAALPLIFAAHQLTEAFVWWGLTDLVPWSTGEAAAWLYLVVAFSLLPVVVPLAVRAVEPSRLRRGVMMACASVGLVVAMVYLVTLTTHPVSAEIDGHRIVYFTHIGEHGVLNGLYVLAGCGALLASTHRRIVAFGIVNLAALALLLWVESNAKTSLWCAWAALTSVAIAAHLRFAHRAPEHPAAVRPGPWLRATGAGFRGPEAHALTSRPSHPSSRGGANSLIDNPQPNPLLSLRAGPDGLGSAVVDAATVVLVPEAPAPLLRGWFHLAAFVVSVPAGVVVVASANSTRARVGALVYAVALTLLFAVSSTYHLRVWSADGRRRMRRVDHGTIYLMIAGCYTPLCLLALRGPAGVALLIVAWVGAAIGLGLAISGLAEKPVFGLACYIGLGWILVVALPDLSRQLSPAHFTLLMVGGLAYTVGGVVLGKNWPNPFPQTFGYHEVWHILVIVACTCHYLTIYSVVSTAA